MTSFRTLASLACALALTTGPARSTAQEQDPAAGYVRPDAKQLEAFLRTEDVHRIALELERRAAFQRAWLDATPEARERARAHLAAGESKAALAAPPSTEVLGEAMFLLHGGTIERYGPLQRLADGLDLRAFPGVFHPCDGARGEPITVRVRPAHPVKPPAEIRLSLYWLAPDGTEIRARTEPVGAMALRYPGFDMYVHAPPTGSGIWRLVPEVEVAGERARGIPVRVDCAADLDPALALAAGDASASPAAATLLDWVVHGVRPTSGLSASELCAQIAAWPDRPASESLVRDADGTWALPPPAAAKRALVLIGSPAEPPEALLAGPLGAAWSAAGHDAGALVVAVGGPVAADGLRALADRVRERSGIESVALVAQGGAVADLLALEASLGGPPLDGVVLATVLGDRNQPPRTLSRPALLVDALAPADEREVVGAAPAPLTWTRRRAPLLAAELELPALVAAWLAETPSPQRREEPPR